MIVRKLGDGRLVCIRQTTHALMAAQFCRHWGNHEFAPPRPYAPVMMAIAQHDTGWTEWETAPRLREDGFPMDFITLTDQAEKTRLWQRGIDRVWGQHPYAALMVSRHASLLYEAAQGQNGNDESTDQEVNRFLADQRQLLERARRLFAQVPEWLAALQPAVLDAHTRLLQFGDRASLQVSVPWATETRLDHCPVDHSGVETELTMRYDEHTILFDPWPFSIDRFEVVLEGYLLDQDHFDNEGDYHRALDEAPFFRKAWQVERQP